MKKDRESRFAAKNNGWMVRQFKHLWKFGVIQCFSKIYRCWLYFYGTPFSFLFMLFIFLR